MVRNSYIDISSLWGGGGALYNRLCILYLNRSTSLVQID